MIDPLLVPFPPSLLGEKTLIRPYVVEDAAALLAGVEEARSTLLPWMPWALNVDTEADQVARIRRSAANILLGHDYMLGMFDRTTGEFVGSTGLHRVDWNLRSFDIGYWIRPSKAGQGYVTDAVRTLTDFAFETFKARRVTITCSVENSSSAAVAERAGFKLEGTLRASILDAYGSAHDRLIYSLVESDRT